MEKMRTGTFFTLLIIFLFNNILSAQTEMEYNLDSLVVIASKTPTPFSEIGRSIETINLKEIKQLPVLTIQELLEQVNGINVKTRGPVDIQSDVSIRGGTFEQTLIMIDGIKLTDPQTGHHNMNLPVSFEQIERIEVLKGDGSGIYGANAFGGVINIITKKNSLNALKLNLQGGENAFYKLGTNASFVYGNSNHHISFSKSKSDGYKFNTEFESYNFSLTNSLNFKKTVLKTIFGYTDKDFGANSFYTTKFPKQAEKTKTKLAAVTADIELNEISILSKLYWRRNKDEFVLDKTNPAFYKNEHNTNLYGSEVQLTANMLGGTTTFSFEYLNDNITSNNLGNHSRVKKGIAAEQRLNLNKKLILNFNGYLYKYAGLNWKLWPGISFAYLPMRNIKVFGNYGKAFRIPTYTELYYNDPITKGNAKLFPEESDNYEIGVNFSTRNFIVNVSFFKKEGKNLIDYVKKGTSGIWEAENITGITTNGFELNAMVKTENLLFGFIEKIKIGYTFLDADKKNKIIISRYTLQNLQHDLNLNIFVVRLFDIKQSWSFNYEVPVNMKSRFLISTKLQKNFGKYNLFLKVSNLLNKTYEEIPGVTLPGRWFTGGLEIILL
jgi:iron complex outermembrane receptor protein